MHFCDEGGSFSQAHSNLLPIEEQVKIGAETLKNRFKAQKFMSYFQAYSNTYKPVNELEKYITPHLTILMSLEFLSEPVRIVLTMTKSN